MEEALLRLKVEIVELCYFQDVIDCVSVVVEVGAGGNADDIHIDADSGPQLFMLEDSVAVDEVHHGLEGCWRVCEAKVHDHWFEEAVFGLECCFVFVSFSNMYVIVSPSYIQFSVDMCIAQVMYEV